MPEYDDMVREGPAQPAPPPREVPAEKARGGEIILRHRIERYIFIGSLAAIVIFAVLIGIR
jgi:hypothetical protein